MYTTLFKVLIFIQYVLPEDAYVLLIPPGVFAELLLKIGQLCIFDCKNKNSVVSF